MELDLCHELVKKVTILDGKVFFNNFLLCALVSTIFLTLLAKDHLVFCKDSVFE